MRLIRLVEVSLFLYFFCCSCESEHEIALPYHHPRLVINGLIKANSPVEFFVTASSNMGELDNRNLDEVKVRLFENGAEVFPEKHV